MAHRYLAFISYSHADRRWAAWLHRKLETFPVPRDLDSVFTQWADGAPKFLRPVFRDRDELASSADLSRAINEALEKSAFLIVLCSPRAASSRWVNEEVITFQKMGRADRILTVIVEGEPNAPDPAQECFPPSLRGDHAEQQGIKIEPIAADLRPASDGKHDGFLKLAAGLLGVGLDALKRRESIRKQRRLAVGLVITTSLAAILAGLSMFAILKSKEAIEQRKKALASLQEAQNVVDQFCTTVATSNLKHTPELTALREELLRDACSYYEQFALKNANDRELSSALQNIYGRLAEMQLNMGETDKGITNLKARLAMLEKLLQAEPDNVDYLVDLSKVYQTLSSTHRKSGDTSSAQAANEKSIEILRPVVAGGSDALSIRSLARSLQTRGELLPPVEAAEARASFEEAARLQEAALRQDPKNYRYQREMGLIRLAYSKFLTGSGDVSEAKNQADKAFQILAKLAQVSLRPGIQLDAARCMDQKGRIAAQNGEMKEAWEWFNEAIVMKTELARQHSHDFEYRYELGVSNSEAAALAKSENNSQLLNLYVRAGIAWLAPPKETVLTRLDYAVEAQKLEASLRDLANNAGVDLKQGNAPRTSSAPQLEAGDDEIFAGDIITLRTRLGTIANVWGVVLRVMEQSSGQVILLFSVRRAGGNDFSAMIPAASVPAIRQAVGEDLPYTLTGRRVRLRGILTTFDNSPQIVLGRSDQIQVAASEVSPDKAELLAATEKDQLIASVGKPVVVGGRVREVATRGPATFVYFEGATQRGDFFSLIHEEYLSDLFKKFGAGLADLVGRDVQVSGNVIEYDGTPQLYIVRPDQIVLAEDDGNGDSANSTTDAPQDDGGLLEALASNTSQLQAAAGREAVITGRVSGVSSQRVGAFVNFEGNRRGDFSGFIDGEHLQIVSKALGGNLADSLPGRTIALTGIISMQNGRPQIRISSADQIVILETAGSVDAASSVASEHTKSEQAFEASASSKAELVSGAGRMAKVTGKVSIVSLKQVGVLLYFEGNSRGDFSGLIPSEDEEKVAKTLGGKLSELLPGKTILLTGIIVLHNGSPQIKIKSGDQITILETAQDADAASPVAGDQPNSDQAMEAAANNKTGLVAAAGRMAVVTGRVSDLSARPAGTLVFFEGNSKGDFCGFIPKEHDLKMAEAYARNLADSLVGKTIALSGRISLHQGAPQIVIETPGQIQIRN